MTDDHSGTVSDDIGDRSAEFEKYESDENSDSKSKALNNIEETQSKLLAEIKTQGNRVFWLTVFLVILTIVLVFHPSVFYEPKEVRYWVCRTIGWSDHEECSGSPPERSSDDTISPSSSYQEWRKVYLAGFNDGMRQMEGMPRFGQVVMIPGSGYFVFPRRFFPSQH